MNRFCHLVIGAVMVAGAAPVLIIAWVLPSVILEEFALLVISTALLLPVFGWSVIVVKRGGSLGDLRILPILVFRPIEVGKNEH